MSSSRFTKTAIGSGLLVAPALLAAAASCATANDDARVAGPATVIETDAGDARDGGDKFGDGGIGTEDGGCNPSDPKCVTELVTCDQAEWCPVPTNVSEFYALTNVWGSGSDDVWATGSGGTVIHWAGAEWKAVTVPPTGGLPTKDTFHGLWGSGPNDVWIAASTGTIFHSTGFANGTAPLERMPEVPSTNGSAAVFAVWGTTSSDVRFGTEWFYGPDGIVDQFVKTESEGTVGWLLEAGLSTIHGYWGSSADDVWLIADGRPYSKLAGQTMHGTRKDGGIVWTNIDSRTAALLHGIWGSSATDVWTVGNQGTIRHIGAGAATATEWEEITSPTTESLNAVWGSGPNDVWIVGNSGTILHWDGATWRSSLAAFTVNQAKPNLYGIWGSAPNDVWAVGDGVVLHLTEHSGGTK